MGSNIFSGLSLKKGDLSIRNFIMLFIAGVINAVGITLLLSPVGLYDSGVSGLAMFLDKLISVMPLWSWLVIINVPIFLFGMKKQGVAFTIYSLFAIGVYSLAAAVFQDIIPLFVKDFLVEGEGSPIVGNEFFLCSVFGGMLSGIGSGITIRYGGTMDGIETLAVIFSKKIGITVGNFVMIFNVILYLTIGTTLICQGTDNAFIIPLFSIVAYFVNGKSVDFITEGIDQAKGALIITTNYDSICSALSEEFGRGLTVINAKGYYSQADKQVIYCVVNRFQLPRLRAVVSRCDKFAFVTVMDISDVLGTSVKNSRAYDKKLAKQRKEAKLHAKELARSEGQTPTDAPQINDNRTPTNTTQPEANEVAATDTQKNEETTKK
jgi:uncharacterized membrane-anchored protein YitT (DUF2179 family)